MPSTTTAIIKRLNTPAVWIASCLAVIVALGTRNIAAPDTADAASYQQLNDGNPWLLDRGYDRTVPLCRTTDYLHAARQAIRNGNGPAIGVMQIAGKTTLLQPHTPVTIVGTTGDVARVRVIDGPNAGETGYVPKRWLTR